MKLSDCLKWYDPFRWACLIALLWAIWHNTHWSVALLCSWLTLSDECTGIIFRLNNVAIENVLEMIKELAKKL